MIKRRVRIGTICNYFYAVDPSAFQSEIRLSGQPFGFSDRREHAVSMWFNCSTFGIVTCFSAIVNGFFGVFDVLNQ